MTQKNPYSVPGYGTPGYGTPGYGRPPMGGPLAPPPQQYTKSSGQKRATGFRFALGYLAVIWAVFILNAVLFGGVLNNFGIHPLDVTALPHIFAAPLLHADVNHIISNSIPGAIFCFLIGYSGSRVFWEVTLIAGVIAGLGTWFMGGIGTNHIGASGLVYGWLAYLIVRGFFNRSVQQISLGVILGFFYSGLIWGVLPGTPGVSWQGHLFGAIGGIVAGMLITSDDPPELKARREQRRALEGRRHA
ncbi:rhomboid family intramembrane serine protease [Corynebacterium qintianiae]|uniref:Rhomboid family intramembrane serine protease n=1 Tax=Corynebacterium qintianiae TaxID=2709392 RepID=A0A7T0KM80_9CORY|nr:rhomboid family intramembrane serine protease [Corynebacterium qintianiae]QPK82914.1 rhomboid family intramembrane serine protease [Corynebacterium qintianiae]